jgi:tRNA pseudouridine38-40 synthase
VCHVDVPSQTPAELPAERLTYRLSRLLPNDLRVRRVSVAPAGFDARFSALGRRYIYRICDDPSAADPLQRRSTLWWRRSLDVPAMMAASQTLLGEHDFAAFCKPRAGATTIRTLRTFAWVRSAETVEATVVADAFCHSMVRALVGCLLVVGAGARPVTWPAEILRAGVRDSRVSVVPAHGLTLAAVRYPPPSELADRAATARAVRTLS